MRKILGIFVLLFSLMLLKFYSNSTLDCGTSFRGMDYADSQDYSECSFNSTTALIFGIFGLWVSAEILGSRKPAFER